MGVIERMANAIRRVDTEGYPDCNPLPNATYRAYAEAALGALNDPIPYRITEAGRAMLRDAQQGEG